MHIFTYGTLMFPEVWQAVTGGDYRSIEGTARGYLAFRVRDAMYPGILAAEPGDVVRGVLYFDVDPAAVIRLDRFEDDFYIRQPLPIECEDGCERLADTYIVPFEQRLVLTNERWTRESFIASGGLQEFVRRFAGFGRVKGEEQKSRRTEEQ